MIKDRYQKQKLLHYCLNKDWYPQLEVKVIYEGGTTTPKPKEITDIDVLALAPSENGILHSVIGDCKTLKNQSAINRVFWLKGLMSLFNSNYGIILLSKKIEGEHKLLANELGVSLLSDNDFKVFASATSKHDLATNAKLANLELWDIYFDLHTRCENLDSLIKYCRTDYWNEESYSVKLRHSITNLRAVRKELNPDKNLHIFLFLETVSLMSLAMNELSIKIFNKFLWPEDKESIDKELKILLWGGYENYSYYNRLWGRLKSQENDLSLPEWSLFVQLVLESLTKPLSTAITPIIIKELGFNYLSDQQSLTENNSYLNYLVKKDSFATKNAILIIDYLAKCANLPKEFIDIPIAHLMRLQRA